MNSTGFSAASLESAAAEVEALFSSSSVSETERFESDSLPPVDDPDDEDTESDEDTDDEDGEADDELTLSMSAPALFMLVCAR